MYRNLGRVQVCRESPGRGFNHQRKLSFQSYFAVLGSQHGPLKLVHLLQLSRLGAVGNQTVRLACSWKLQVPQAPLAFL